MEGRQDMRDREIILHRKRMRKVNEIEMKIQTSLILHSSIKKKRNEPKHQSIVIWDEWNSVP